MWRRGSALARCRTKHGVEVLSRNPAGRMTPTAGLTGVGVVRSWPDVTRPGAGVVHPMGPKQARGRIHNVATPELKAPPMNRIRRFLVRGLLAFLGLLAVLAALLAYFTKQPPAKAGGFVLRTESPDTRRLNDASHSGSSLKSSSDFGSK